MKNAYESSSLYVTKFYEHLAAKIIEDEETLWVPPEIEEGFAAYVAKRVAEWGSDANIEVIPVLICSRGGALDDALAAYSLLRYYPKPKRAFVFHASSAAVLIALACDERVGFSTTTILLHDLSMDFSGTGDSFREELKSVEIYQDIMTQIITSRTRIPLELWMQRRKGEWFMDAQEAYRYGILTSIEGTLPLIEHKTKKPQKKPKQSKIENLQGPDN